MRHGFTVWGGETEGLRRLRAMLGRTSWVGEFQKPQTSPTDMWHPVPVGRSAGKDAGMAALSKKLSNPFEVGPHYPHNETLHSEAYTRRVPFWVCDGI
jgi:hypothetical protein